MMKSVVLNFKNKKQILINNITSAILLIIIAFKAALLAKIRVNQKLISKYEQRPTPSQPINNCIRLSELTNKSMKKVKSDK